MQAERLRFVVRPVVAVHDRLVGIDVVREDDIPVLPFQCQADQSDAGEEFGGFRAGVAVSRGCSREAIGPFCEAFQQQAVARSDLMMLEERPDPGAVSEVAAWFAGRRIRADVGVDCFAESVELNRDFVSRLGLRFSRRPKAVGFGKKS